MAEVSNPNEEFDTSDESFNEFRDVLKGMVPRGWITLDHRNRHADFRSAALSAWGLNPTFILKGAA